MNPVLKSLEPILKEPQFVFINKRRIEEIAPEIAKEKLPIPEWREEVFIEDDKKAIDFFMLFNSINFAFADFATNEKFTTFYKGKEWKGAFGMIASLKRALEKGIPLLNANYLTQIDRNGLRAIFKGNIEIPMLDERLEIFHEVGNVLLKKYKGHFCNLLEDGCYYAFNNGKGIIEKLVTDFPSFNDISEFNGHILKFYKRAQLAVASLYGRLRKKGFNIKDIDDLTVFADYELPARLRQRGIIEYEESLENKILNYIPIEKDSRGEQEIRASTVDSCDSLVKEINKYRKNKINSLSLDYKFWSERRIKKENGYPHHLTKTIAY